MNEECSNFELRFVQVDDRRAQKRVTKLLESGPAEMMKSSTSRTTQGSEAGHALRKAQKAEEISMITG